MAYDLHCKLEAAPCTPSKTGYVNTTTFTVHAGGEVAVSNGGLMAFTFPFPLLPNRELNNCSGSDADCPVYTYATQPGVGQAKRLRSGGFLQLVGATMVNGSGGGSHSAMFAMVSNTGDEWTSAGSVPAAGCRALGENDWAYQSDKTTILAIFRNSGPESTLCASRSVDEGHTWSAATVMKLPQPNNVLPRLACLSNGLIVLSTGRIGLYVYVSPDNGTAWESLDIALNHNVLSPRTNDRFSEAFVRGAGDSTMSTSYTSLVHYAGTDVVQVCYDRLGNGWDPAPGSYGDTSSVWCSKLQVAVPR